MFFVFINVGYAQVADALSVTGSMQYKFEFEGILISSVELDSDSVNGITAGDYEEVFPTNLKNTVTLTDNNASVTYKITFTNISSRYTYTYKGIQCDTSLDSFDNGYYSKTAANNKFIVSLVKEDGKTFAEGTSIKPGEEIVLYATYTFNRNMQKNREFSFFLNYKFGVHVSSMGEMAVEKTLSAFIEALNTPEEYGELILHIDDKFAGEPWQANYIGNVSQAGSGTASEQAKQDAAVVEGLIGSGLTLTIDGVTKNVTVLIKRENLDGNPKTGDAYKAEQIEQQKNNNGTWWNPNDDFYEDVVVATTYGSGCEMAIYMTPNNLNKKIEAGEYAGDAGWAEVFVAISTCTNNGSIGSDGTTVLTSDWYQIGDIYEGIANIVTYEGGNGNGSFVTDNWKSIHKTYKVTENYSYTIEAGQSIGTITQYKIKNDPQAKIEFERLRNLANKAIAHIDANSDYFKIIEYAKPIETLRKVATEANKMIVDDDTTRSSLIPILRELENAVYPFQSFI